MEDELLNSDLGEKDSEWDISASRVTQAIEEDKFCLFCQVIIPMKQSANMCTHHEILIRMSEEEDNLIPPGTFLPFVEKYKMMPRLDRWVVRYVLQWLSSHQLTPGSIFFINIAKDTLCDPDFPDFVRGQLQETGVSAEMICFEVEEPDVSSRLTDVSRFVSEIRDYGCRIALCSFGRDPSSFDLLRSLKIDFLKIDGNMVCFMFQDPINLAKVTAINRVAHTIGIQTVAEQVETDDVIAKLREIEVDFAQGFGLGRPFSLDEFT